MITQTRLERIKLKDIKVSENYRRSFSEEELEELSKSILEQGLIQPILIRPVGKKYELVCGGRRFAAYNKLEPHGDQYSTIEANIREMTAAEVLEVQITENLQRKDPHPIDEAMAFKRLHEEAQLSIKDIAVKLGKTEKYVRSRMSLNNLHSNWTDLYYRGKLSNTIADRLSKYNKETQLIPWNDSYHQTEKTIRELKGWSKMEGDLKSANWELDKDGINGCVACIFCLKCSITSPTFSLSKIAMKKKRLVMIPLVMQVRVKLPIV